MFTIIPLLKSFRFAEEELAKHQLAASQRWGFDFARGQPLEDTKLYLWERVPPTNDIPEMYTLSRAAHIRSIDNDLTKSPNKRRHYRTSSYIDLLDERSELSNKHKPTNNLLDLSFEDVDGGHSSGSSCDEESFEESTHEKMLIDSVVVDINSSTSSDNSNCNNSNNHSLLVQSKTAINTDVRLINKRRTTTANATFNRISNNSSSSISSSSCRNNNNGNSSSSTNNFRNLRSSPRNREKRQPKITGTHFIRAHCTYY